MLQPQNGAFVRHYKNVTVYLTPDPPVWKDADQESFSGTVKIQTNLNDGLYWDFKDLLVVKQEESKETVDIAARAALRLGTLYPSSNRKDIPSWAPSAHFADNLVLANVFE